jgi:hypothetical protein
VGEGELGTGIAPFSHSWEKGKGMRIISIIYELSGFVLIAGSFNNTYARYQTGKVK